ncbi:MAG TPA: prohibitin family protein [Cyclobacteriaceae bacterium]|nr:prohibitin family protein [Cyclobacteriaceae bacterium]HRJ80958.1 prohibitin family protein [Cyclobacteriaceae bacterium]
MKTNTNLLIAAGILLLIAGGCSVVKPGHNAMRWKPLGKGLVTDKIYPNGVVWHWPWSGVVDYNMQWQTYNESISILTEDELHIDMTVSVTLRPIPSELPALELEVGKDYYDKVIRPEFVSQARYVFSKYKYNLVSPKSPEIEAAILERLVSVTKGKHLEFNNVTVKHIQYPMVVTSAVDKKLAVQQAIEQKDYEIKIAEKNAEIQRILAKGQRDAQQIIEAGLTQRYLQYKALEVQDKLTGSPNTKFYFVPLGKDGLPVIVDTHSDK